MSVADIRAILEARNASTPQTRIASLMWYAFHFDSPDNKPYRPLPELANDVATNDRTTLEWLQGRETRRDKTRFEKIDNLLKADQRRELEDFMDDTDYLRDEYEWVANADRIRRMMPLHREAVFVEVAVRQLILEAEAETAGNTPEN